MHRTWIEISRSRLRSNLDEIQKCLGKQDLIAGVVKANAYGHGIDLISKTLQELGISFFCVDSIEEALNLMNVGITQPILIMGYVNPTEFVLLKEPMRLCVYSLEALKLLEESGQNHKIHLKLETGLNRLGFSESDLKSVMAMVNQSSQIEVEGAYTHYANVEDTLSSEFYTQQYSKFQKLTENLPASIMRHSCASAAALLHPQATQAMVRIGIALYGYYSSWQTLLSLKERGRCPSLEPILKWKTRIAQIKEIRSGDRVGYGCTHQALTNGKIAILPVGYYDGYDRHYGMKAHVLIREQRAPIIGRIAMNMCSVDITHIPQALTGDEVVLLGTQGNGAITAEELAEASQTIHYEVLTRISPHLARIIQD